MEYTRFSRAPSTAASVYYRSPPRPESRFDIVDTTQAMRMLGTYHKFRSEGRSMRLYERPCQDSGSYNCKLLLAIQEVSKCKLRLKSMMAKLRPETTVFPESAYTGRPFAPIIHLENVLQYIAPIENEGLMQGALNGIRTLKASLDKKPAKWREYSVRLEELAVRIERQLDAVRGRLPSESEGSKIVKI